MLYNKDKTCRCCLQEPDNLISLYDYCFLDPKSLLILELFTKCTNLNIDGHANLPQKICENCLDELVSAYNFQEKCKKSDSLLKTVEANREPADDLSFKIQHLTDIDIDSQFEMETLVENSNEKLLNEKNDIGMIDDCNKTRVHKNTHNNETGFKCEYCDKTFPRQIMKFNHLRSHTVDRSFKCSICPESRASKSGLINHLVTHTHKLRCDICNLNFKNRRSEIIHMKRNRNCSKHIAAQKKINITRLRDKEVATAQKQIDEIRSNSMSKSKRPAELRFHSNLHNQTQRTTNAFNPIPIVDESGTKYKCFELTCGKTFASSISYREHLKIHNPESAVKCDYCDKIFSSKAKREPHHRTHRGERPYSCSVCPAARTTKSSLLKHLLCHARSLKCKPCAISFESSRSYVVHMKIHADDPNYNPNNDSDSQDELDENQLKLKQQIEEIRSTTMAQKRNINTKCTVCYREFATPSELKLHSEIHQGVGDYLCVICGKTSLTRAGYREHMFLHEPSGKFQCEHCDKVCSSSYQLKIHRRKHTGEKPYLCNICGKSFTTSNVLLVHNRLHTGVKPFKCIVDGCTAAFRTTSKLNRHRMVMHSTIRRYECNVCSKKFAFSDEYKAHALTHSTETAYECGICAKGFIKDYDLKVHLRLHTGEKPYKCEICLRPFRLKTSLNSHVKWKHTNDK